MRVLLFIAVALALVGCKTNEAPLTTNQATAHAIITETEEVNTAVTNQRKDDLNALGEMLFEEVTENCRRAHHQYINGVQPVDCGYTYPANITLSFPSFAYHNRQAEVVEKFVSRWCQAVRLLTGETSKFTRASRKEHYSERTSCTVPE